jgi:hypothetical protein
VKVDSWFGHVRLADNFGQQGIRAVMQIKSGHALYPENLMEENLKEAPGGCWITMKGKVPPVGLTYYKLDTSTTTNVFSSLWQPRTPDRQRLAHPMT